MLGLPHILARVVLLGTLPCTLLAAELPPQVEVSHVRRVFHNGEHNAFTDLTVFQGAFYLAFRSCPDGHGVSPNASVIILRSKDARSWEQVHRFSVPKRDTRDPHFLVFKGRLLVFTGTWFSGDEPARSSRDLDLNQHLGFACHTTDGASWSEPLMLEGTFGHYIWRAAAHGDKAYLCGRRKIGFQVGPRGEGEDVESLMLESSDGLTWQRRATFQERRGDETAFRFERDGSVLAIGRRRGTAQVLRSPAPWQTWERRDLDRHIGGPLLTQWGSRTVVGGRHHVAGEGPRTSLYWLLEEDRLHEFARLPSGGDNSYPGLVAIDNHHAIVSWYSSHETNPDGVPITAIYLADLHCAEDLSQFTSAEQEQIVAADQVLRRQRGNGGWPKGTDDHSPLRLRLERDLEDTTLDNGSTHQEIELLARAFTATRLPRFRDGCLDGIEFLLAAQYSNGGWPQRFPNPRGYARHITFNDHAMIGALRVLRGVARGTPPFEWADDDLRERAGVAVARGVECILRCQVVVDGLPTAWGQQHDELTFEPRPARSFEPASLCTAESVEVVRFLMQLEPATPEIREHIEGAIAWLSGPARLGGIRQVSQDPVGKRIISDPEAPPLWARLYELGTNLPIFGDRDGKTYYSLAEISDERRQGYSWYGSWPRGLLEREFPEWQRRHRGDE